MFPINVGVGGPPDASANGIKTFGIPTCTAKVRMHCIPISLRFALVLMAVPASPARSAEWFQNTQPSKQVRRLIEVFASAADNGLDPEDYHASEWIARTMRATRQEDDALNRTFTSDAERYTGDLRFGRIPARTPEICAEIEKIVSALAISADPRVVLNGLDPPFPAYRRTLKVLEQYRRLARAGDGQPIPPPAGSRREGDHWSGFQEVERRLRFFGDLPEGGELTDAVRRFQMRHGLATTGAIDRATVLAMNVPVAYRIRQIELTLERWRWAPRSFSYPPIVVNIPQFELRAFDEVNRTALRMKVVVGRALGHRTPVFQAEMKYVIFNPWWEVPPSIAKRELAPQFGRSAGELRKDNYEVVRRDGSLVTREAVPTDVLERIRSGEFRVRQAPGARNALGSVKFIFPNSHNVYLHGTPTTELFSRTRRDFSHGCIRVEHPEELAKWVLRQRPEWTAERIHDGMSNGRTTTVTLSHAIPVLIVYGTAIVPESGEAHFLQDIYGLDATLDNQLHELKMRRTDGL